MDQRFGKPLAGVSIWSPKELWQARTTRLDPCGNVPLWCDQDMAVPRLAVLEGCHTGYYGYVFVEYTVLSREVVTRLCDGSVHSGVAFAVVNPVIRFIVIVDAELVFPYQL